MAAGVFLLSAWGRFSRVLLVLTVSHTKCRQLGLCGTCTYHGVLVQQQEHWGHRSGSCAGKANTRCKVGIDPYGWPVAGSVRWSTWSSWSLVRSCLSQNCRSVGSVGFLLLLLRDGEKLLRKAREENDRNINKNGLLFHSLLFPVPKQLWK